MKLSEKLQQDINDLINEVKEIEEELRELRSKEEQLENRRKDIIGSHVKYGLLKQLRSKRKKALRIESDEILPSPVRKEVPSLYQNREYVIDKITATND